ncbi:MAG: hypothetical protein KJS77_10855, partial [Planctomycetes bacterium]|nr:hypothetical protein [Planctomycetota bacterium]
RLGLRKKVWRREAGAEGGGDGRFPAGRGLFAAGLTSRQIPHNRYHRFTLDTTIPTIPMTIR